MYSAYCHGIVDGGRIVLGVHPNSYHIELLLKKQASFFTILKPLQQRKDKRIIYFRSQNVSHSTEIEFMLSRDKHKSKMCLAVDNRSEVGHTTQFDNLLW